ncbi:MAG: MFS transporter, partial [Chitinophagaceae bacterium]|nr:MFS transporter [Chitinophagaceae bacterium]
VCGPLFAGVLMAWIGLTPTIFCAFCALIICGLLMMRIRKRPFTAPPQGKIWENVSQGFRFIFSNKIILAVLSLDLFAVLFGGAEALLPVFSDEILKCGATGYGWLRSAHGIGSLLLLFVLAYLPLKTRVGDKLLWSIAGFGICIILFGISTHFWFSFVCLFFAGMFDGVSVVIRHSILQLKTPEEIKGRVSSVNMMFISSSNELGAFESGLAARFLGTVPAVVFGGCMTVLIVIVTFFGVPTLRKVQLNDQKHE